MNSVAEERSPALPPIVLLVHDDPDTVDMYSTYFESSGLWVSTSAVAREAIDTVADLRPDIVVTDIGFGGASGAGDFVLALKASDATRHIPVIVLSGLDARQLPPGTHEAADLCLVKPVLPDVLLLQVRTLLRRSHELRQRGHDARHRAQALRQKSNLLHERRRTLEQRVESERRRCPGCGGALGRMDRGRIGGAEYDYYRECASGCGLYCYDRDGARWLRLA